MFKDAERPRVGQSAGDLGVRVPNDIQTLGTGNVLPGTGGMSVAPGWRKLPPHRIPARLQAIAPEACGNTKTYCWRFGEGDFASGRFAAELDLRLTSAAHGNVEPAAPMGLAAFEAALAMTRDGWRVDET
jgi:hypothetical protein